MFREEMVPDPITLGAIAAAIVTGAANQTGVDVTDGVRGAFGRVVNRLRQRFTDEAPDDRALNVMELAQAVPDSPSREQALAKVIDEHVDLYPQFRDELQRLVAEAASAGVDVTAISQSARGNQNVQAANVRDSTITVNLGPRHSPPDPG